jgi:hypothetical protein
MPPPPVAKGRGWGMAIEQLHVTPAQFDAIEAAWDICSFGNSRKATQEWGRAFRQCVAEVIGREPPDAFRLVQVEQLPLLDPAEELALAKATPGGTELSPAARALYEQEGAARFAAHHRIASPTAKPKQE